MNDFKVGDVVKPTPESRFTLRSGSDCYYNAVVVNYDPCDAHPLVLVSTDTTMRWETTIDPNHFEVVGKASSDLLSRCRKRLLK